MAITNKSSYMYGWTVLVLSFAHTDKQMQSVFVIDIFKGVFFLIYVFVLIILSFKHSDVMGVWEDVSILHTT